MQHLAQYSEKLELKIFFHELMHGVTRVTKTFVAENVQTKSLEDDVK